MKEIPILFSTPMVQAILAFLKNMTRRVIKDFELTDDEYASLYIDAKGQLWAMKYWKSNNLPVLPQKAIKCPYGKPGDILWVREKWQWIEGFAGSGCYVFRTDERIDVQRWRPSIHMPKEAARIWLQVTDVRVERLQDITEEDAIAEGVEWKIMGPEYSHLEGQRVYKDYRNPDQFECGPIYAKDSFTYLWQSINGAESWEANPWVWVISFKVLSTTDKPDLQTLKAIA